MKYFFYQKIIENGYIYVLKKSPGFITMSLSVSITAKSLSPVNKMSALESIGCYQYAQIRLLRLIWERELPKR
jgi:hypothetical protein